MFQPKDLVNCLQDKECCERSHHGINWAKPKVVKSMQVLGTENNRDQDKQEFPEPRQGITLVSLDQI